MAGSLRDMFVRFGIKYDGKGAKKAGDDLDGLGKKSKEFFQDAQGRWRHISGRFASQAEKAGLGVKRGFFDTVKGSWTELNQKLEVGKKIWHGVATAIGAVTDVLEAGSSAQETDNLLREVFKTGTEGVKEFARVSGQEIGRSQFQLEKYAGIIGALVSPQLQSMGDAGQKAAADISKDFSVLAIDLASFFNTSEDDALNALRSGVSGETEPLKRFGINLTEEGISNALGIDKKKFRDMNVAQKTLARYQAIMKLTVNAQGDAARTADGYANTVRALESAWLDLKTTIGEALLPLGTGVGKALKDSLQWMVNNKGAMRDFGRAILFVAGPILGALAANMLRVQLVALATSKVFTLVGLKAAGAALLAAAPWILLGIALIAFGLILEDIWVGLNGGESAIGKIVDQMLGWKGAAQDVANAMFDTDFFTAWIEGFEQLTQKVREFFSGKVEKLMELGASFFGKTAGEQEASAAANTARSRQTLNPPTPRGNVAGGPGVPGAPVFNMNFNGGSGTPQETGREVHRGVNRALAEQRRGTLQGT